MSRSKTLRWLDQRVAVLEGQHARRERARADRARRLAVAGRAGAAGQPTDDLAESIAHDIRRGGTPWVAAVAHGVMPDTFARWMREGARAMAQGEATVEAAFVARLTRAHSAAFAVADREVAARQEETR